ncbi:MAG: tRNA (cytidine(34)-2'-O)-methyltransferase [Gammaproteobacteria bacterium]
MFHIVLLNPEIPPNTGNVIRLAANTGAVLHLAGETGFDLSDRRMRRAGLDYREYAEMRTHDSLAAAFAAAGDGRRFAAGARGETRFDAPRYRPGDIFVFGRESSGLPPEVFAAFAPERRLHIPMRPGGRSMNLSNAVAVVVMEAWRQNNFRGARRTPVCE